jgi:hypothetical protein
VNGRIDEGNLMGIQVDLIKNFFNQKKIFFLQNFSSLNPQKNEIFSADCLRAHKLMTIYLHNLFKKTKLEKTANVNSTLN